MLNRRRSIYKVVLLGDARVGKTSLRRRYLGKGFTSNYMVTLGADFAIKRIDESAVQIWDLAGQEVYKHVRDGYYHGAQGIILVFDLVNRESFDHVPKWLDEVNAVIDSKIPMVLVGNKSDLREQYDDSVSVEEAEDYAKALSDWTGYDVKYIEASALTGLNVGEIFDELINQIKMYLSLRKDL